MLLTLTRTLRDDRVSYVDPLAGLPPGRVAHPPEERLVHMLRRLARHASRDRTRPPVDAAPFADPARPETDAELVPCKLHWAVGQVPHVLLENTPLALRDV